MTDDELVVVPRRPTVDGATIHAVSSVEQWAAHCPPAGAGPWTEGYSARLTAETWLSSGRPRVPEALRALLESHPATRDLRIKRAYPEHDPKLGDGARGPRRHDVLLEGLASGRAIVVAVESKTDEPLDLELGDSVAAATRQLEAGVPTRRIARLQRFTRALFGRPLLVRQGGAVALDPELRLIDYQLVSATVGALREAHDADATHAVVCVHAFYAPDTDPAVRAAHAAGVERFVSALAPGTSITDGRLSGPMTVPGGAGVPAIPLLVGACVTDVPPVRAPRHLPSTTVLARRAQAVAASLASPALRAAVDACEGAA